MQSSALQQRVSTNIPTSAERCGLSKGPSVELSVSDRSTLHPSASHSRPREVHELQLRLDELEAEKAYFVTRVHGLEHRLNESESRCAALEEALHSSQAKTSPSVNTTSASQPATASGVTQDGTVAQHQCHLAETSSLQAQINELRHVVREISQRNSLPRDSSLEHSVRSELRSPPAVNPELQKLREVILHQQHIIKALQGELDWVISPSPVNAVQQPSKSRTLPERHEEAARQAPSTARTVMGMRSASDSKDPADPAATVSHGAISSSESPNRRGPTEEPEPQPPHPVRSSAATPTEDAEPFVMSYATLDPVAVLGNTSFDPFTGKAVRLDAHQRQQSDEEIISARSTALCGSRLSQAVQETATRLQLAFNDMDEEEAMTESAATPPPRRAVLLPKLSAFNESFGDLGEPSSYHETP